MPTNQSEEIYGNALNLIPQIGPTSLALLKNQFGNFQSAWEAKRADYVAHGLNPKLAEIITTKKSEINPLAEYEKLARHGIEIILSGTVAYPSILAEIKAYPPILYVRGNKSALHASCIGVVGTRKFTPYGRAACEEITTGLINSGLTIVSGLAFGIDACTLDVATTNRASCVGVVASALDDDSLVPKSNFHLAQKVIECGCIISEYPLGASVQKQNFPIRNRIIAGLSLGTVIVEADLESGALITANYALEQNREVFAVPGSIFSQVSKGTNDLIKRGAKLVTSYVDVLEELNLDITAVEVPLDADVSDQEQEVLSTLTREPIHIDDLTRQIHKPASEIAAALAILEMKGRVRSLGGAKFAKIR